MFYRLIALCLLCASVQAATTTGSLEPSTGTWRAYRGSGFTTLVCSANSEAALLACAAADAERRAASTRYQIRYPNRYVTVAYAEPAPAPPPPPADSGLQLIYRDDFESATLERSATGRGSAFQWLSGANVLVGAIDGTRALRFRYGEWAEQRFDLGADYREVELSYAIRYPSDFRQGSGGNNKFFRLYPQVGSGDDSASYGSGEKVGASTWSASGGFPVLAVDMDIGRGIGGQGEGYRYFPGPNDLGRWVKIKIHCTAPTARGKGAIVRIWADGKLLQDVQADNWKDGERHSYRFGYLLGHPNAPIRGDIYIDNVEIRAQ